jgi:hypothetical protein
VCTSRSLLVERARDDLVEEVCRLRVLGGACDAVFCGRGWGGESEEDVAFHFSKKKNWDEKKLKKKKLNFSSHQDATARTLSGRTHETMHRSASAAARAALRSFSSSSRAVQCAPLLSHHNLMNPPASSRASAPQVMRRRFSHPVNNNNVGGASRAFSSATSDDHQQRLFEHYAVVRGGCTAVERSCETHRW